MLTVPVSFHSVFSSLAFKNQLEQQKQKIQLTWLATMTSPQPAIDYCRLWLAHRYLLLTHVVEILNGQGGADVLHVKRLPFRLIAGETLTSSQN